MGGGALANPDDMMMMMMMMMKPATSGHCKASEEEGDHRTCRRDLNKEM